MASPGGSGRELDVGVGAKDEPVVPVNDVREVVELRLQGEVVIAGCKVDRAELNCWCVDGRERDADPIGVSCAYPGYGALVSGVKYESGGAPSIVVGVEDVSLMLKCKYRCVSVCGGELLEAQGIPVVLFVVVLYDV